MNEDEVERFLMIDYVRNDDVHQNMIRYNTRLEISQSHFYVLAQTCPECLPQKVIHYLVAHMVAQELEGTSDC